MRDLREPRMQGMRFDVGGDMPPLLFTAAENKLTELRAYAPHPQP